MNINEIEWPREFWPHENFGRLSEFDKEYYRLNQLAETHALIVEANKVLNSAERTVNAEDFHLRAHPRCLHRSRIVILRYVLNDLADEVQKVTVNRWGMRHVTFVQKQASETLIRCQALMVNLRLGDPEDAWGADEQEIAEMEYQP